MFSRIKQSYKNFEFVTSMKSTTTSSILMRIDFSIESTSKSWIMTNNSIVKTLRVILLHLIKNQCMIFVVLIKSAKQITYSICDDKSLLLTKNESMNIINRKIDWFSFTYLRSRDWLIICQFNRLFSAVMSSEVISIDWAARDRSNDASDWHIEIRYASRARWAIYWFLKISIALILSRTLVMIIDSIKLINCMSWMYVCCLK